MADYSTLSTLCADQEEEEEEELFFSYVGKSNRIQFGP
jgi:hypothetical protein